MKSGRSLNGRWRWALAIVLSLGAGGSLATTSGLPERFSATYDVIVYGVTVGETRWTLEQESAERSRFQSQTRPVGFASLVLDGERREHSVFTLDDSGRPQPLQYRFERSGPRARNAAIDFDWTTLKAVSRYRDRTVELALAPGTLDGMVYVLALMQELAANRPEIQLQLVERGKVKTYLVKREGYERVETALGEIDTVRISRSAGDDRKTTVWAAPGLRYLPARIEHRDTDDTPITLRLRSAQFAP